MQFTNSGWFFYYINQLELRICITVSSRISEVPVQISTSVLFLLRKMKLVIVLAAIVAITLAELPSDKERWVNFKTKFNKSYKNAAEENTRYSIFRANLRKIEEHNKKFESGASTFKMGTNQFTDMTVEEFKSKLGFQQASKPDFTKRTHQYFVSTTDDDVPDSIDWSQKGAVTEIKDQGMCGSCWSFSTTGTLEGQYFQKTGKLVSFSEQNLVDCDNTCYGCMGGFMDEALQWIEENGIMSEEDYPYVGVDEQCFFDPTKSVTKISSYVYVKENDENELKKAVATIGPVSVAIDCSENMQMYESGILDDRSCSNSTMYLNHGVLAVGYGTQDGKDYWIVKNSWGTSWGQQGYIWMSRNAGNQCGIADEPVYPVL